MTRAEGAVSCGHDAAQDGVWPSASGADICHDCFEVEADQEWWEMVRSIPRCAGRAALAHEPTFMVPTTDGWTCPSCGEEQSA